MAQTEKTSMALMSRAAQMLAEANTIQKAKELKDLALTASDWARRRDMGEDAIREAKAYALAAERRMGQMLNATERRSRAHEKGGGGKGSVRAPLPDAPPTLADLGLTKKESARAQKVADLPEEQFQAVASGEIPLASALKKPAPEPRPGVGVLRANEAINALKMIPRNDPLRARAFQIVIDWIKANKEA